MAPDDRIELARGLFAMITMALEDAATLAADGQAPSAQHRELAERLARDADKIGILAKAARTVLD